MRVREIAANSAKPEALRLVNLPQRRVREAHARTRHRRCATATAGESRRVSATADSLYYRGAEEPRRGPSALTVQRGTVSGAGRRPHSLGLRLHTRVCPSRAFEPAERRSIASWPGAVAARSTGCGLVSVTARVSVEGWPARSRERSRCSTQQRASRRGAASRRRLLRELVVILGSLVLARGARPERSRAARQRAVRAALPRVRNVASEAKFVTLDVEHGRAYAARLMTSPAGCRHPLSFPERCQCRRFSTRSSSLADLLATLRSDRPRR